MNCKALLFVALAALVALQFASAHPLSKRSCACGLKGTDVCSSCIPAAVPRPGRPGRVPTGGMQRVVYQKFAPVEFKPQDICTCAGGLVTAPEIPRVACKVHSGPTHQSPNYYYPGSNGLFLGGGDDCGDAPVNPCEEGGPAPSQVKTYVIPAENSVPAEELIEEVQVAPSSPVAADAVSLALAYDMATKAQKNIQEENLAFGHMQTPKDGRVVIKKKVVPESSLYAVRNQIVELKAPSGFGRSCEDEAEASLLAAQQASCGEVEESSYGASMPSYRDLGFAPVGGDCKFVPGQYQPSPQVVQTVEYSVPAAPAAPAGPAYGPCDALASLERGRGSNQADYYSSEAQAEAAADAAAADAAAPNCEDSESGSSYGSYAAAAPSGYGIYSSSAAAPAPRAAPVHTGRRGCSCGCGY